MSVHQELRWHAQPETLGMARDSLQAALEGLCEGVELGQHPGAQVYLSRHGQPLLEFACGEAAPGVPLGIDTVTAWFSACKPLTAMAIALLYDRGRLGLDDPVSRYLPGFRNGKESCTLRHVLTHQGGFAGAVRHDDTRTWDEIIAAICAHPAEYLPGTRAGYHPTAGWYVLGEIVRLVDGRPVQRFLADELLEPLGMADSRLGIPPAEQRRLGPRLARVALGMTERQPYADQAFVERFNSAAEIARINPSGGVRGPARDLGRFYEWMLAGGRRGEQQLVDRRTAELFVAGHRWGLPDATLMGANLAWGLGFALHGNADIDRAASRRVFGHSGMVSSVGFADPVVGLAMAVVSTGLLDPMTNARRLRAVSAGAYAACAVR